MKNKGKTDKIIEDRFKNMTASQKLELSLKLNHDARKLKESVIKQKFPELSDVEIKAMVRDIFLYART